MITNIIPSANRNVNRDANQALRKARREKAKREQLKQENAKQEEAKLRKAKRPLAHTVLARVLAINAVTIVATVLVSAPFQLMERPFVEGGAITYFSAIQLFTLSYLSYQVFKERALSRKKPLLYPIAVWIIISIGFAFLALDELFTIHEWVEATIHTAGQFKATGLSVRIDDLIVGSYGAAAIWLLAHYRRELRKYRCALPYFIAGGGLAVLMMGLDVLTSGSDLSTSLVSGQVTTPMTTDITSWALLLEETLKLFSESFLIVAVYLCAYRARQLNPEKLSA